MTTTLEDYGLEAGHTVRFQKVKGGTYQTGTAMQVNRDGSIDIYAGGLTRCIRPERVERKGRGPRGGVTWTALVHEHEPEDR